MTEFNQPRLANVWGKISGESDSSHSESIYAALLAYYQESQRSYHNTNHIHECLCYADRLSELPGYSEEVEIAIWFHDAIYLAGAQDNERKSMEWFTACADGHFGEQPIGEIQQLIMATDHKHMPTTLSQKLIVDIDLSGFSSERERFIADGKKIRAEYSHVPDDEFIRDQTNFLNRLLDRPSIYSTDHFMQHNEQIARSNIHYLLNTYSKGIQPW